MKLFIQELVLFLMTFFVVFLLYRFFIVRRALPKNKKNHKKKDSKEPVEVTYLVTRYNLDLEKVNYKRLLLVISIVSSFDIALIISIILIIKIFILEIILGFVSTLIIILLSYHIVYLVYKKKGMIKNES